MIYYFAYGSNMCLGRLRERVPSCKFITTAQLKEYELQFHKKSKDGSGKADAYKTNNPDDEVWGVVFEIIDSEKEKLGKCEGTDYDECEVKVIGNDGTELNVKTYCAKDNAIEKKGLKPYTWYKRFVIEGAKQHNLPHLYIQEIEKVDAIKDTNSDRNREKQKILCN